MHSARNAIHHRLRLCAAALAMFGLSAGRVDAQTPPHNVIIFVADGLRSAIVNDQTAPALEAVREAGVDLRNSHSLFPTVTTPNASAIATGHRLGDTGDFGNVLYVQSPFAPPYSAPFAAVEDDVVLGLLDERYGGNYLNEVSLLQAARAHGFETASIGKLGPVGVQDVTARDGAGSIIIDDATGYPGGEGIRLAPEISRAIKAAGLPTAAPDRGLNTYPGAYNMPGVQVANIEQQAWFVSVATKVLLPRFKASGKPFVMVYWSRDPDGTQHNQGDSLNTLTPGINGPTTMAAIRNASDNLAALRAEIAALGLEATTDIIVTADHGFSVVSRESRTSAAAKQTYPDVKPGFLPPGFLAIDLSQALNLKLYDPNGIEISLKDGFHPRNAALLGPDPKQPKVAIAAQGGSDLIYLPGPPDRALAAQIVRVLTEEDYVGAIFVSDDLGPIAGALPTSAVGLSGAALTPAPSIVVSFKSFSTGCDNAEICGAEVADTDLQQGQGIHGSFGRQDTHNFMAAVGPDFRSAFVDDAPVSNADLAPTLARILGLDLGGHGGARGRVITEALTADGARPRTTEHVLRSTAAANGFTTILRWQDADGVPYFDAAGMPGRTIGLGN